MIPWRSVSGKEIKKKREREKRLPVSLFSHVAPRQCCALFEGLKLGRNIKTVFCTSALSRQSYSINRN